MHLIMALLLQASYPGPAGGGMLGVREADVLPARSAVVGMGLDNFDRDPLGLDIVELPLRLRVGLGKRFELSGSAVISRAVVIAQDQPWPPPPADISLAPGAVAPTGPDRAVYWQAPYLGHHSSSIGDFVPGDTTLGLTWQVCGPYSARPALTLTASVTIPNDTDYGELRRGANNARLSEGLLIAATWRHERWSWSADVGGRVSPAYRPDRVIGEEGLRFEQLHPPVLGTWGLGTRFRATRRLSFSGEFVGFQSVGGHTATLDGIGAVDFLLGAHLNMGRGVLSVGFRQHLDAPPDGSVHRTGPLAGAVDLSGAAPEAAREFLRQLGAPDVLPRPGASRLVLGVGPDVALPAGAVRVPETYAFSTTGNDGIVFGFSVRVR